MKSITSLLIILMAWMIPFYGASQVIPCTVNLNASLGGLPPVPPTYNLANGNISTCSGIFYDPGGTGNYANNIGLTTMTLCSDQPGEQIILDFSAYGFQVETGFDFLNIYDGTGTGGTQLWDSQAQGGSVNPGVITSTTGCLTITFSSDGSVTYQGWGADISCTNPPPAGFDCNGGDVLLTATGQGQQTTVMSNNFNAGLGTGWVSTGGSAVGSPCGPSLDGTDYYWASTSTGTPNLTTIDYDVSCGGTLSFDMAYATQGGAAPCEGPDLPDEGVTLQYSTDGGATWTVIQYWNPNGGYDPQMTAWNNYSIPIPPGAQGPNTQFQWVQTNSSGTCCDNWGIDNVMITANTNCAAYWYDYNHIPNYPDPNTDLVNVTTTTTFGVWYTNGTDSCYASTTVIVPPGTTADAGPDQTICAAGTVTIGGAPTSPDNGATYTWSTGATGTIGAGDNGQIDVSPTVTTEYYLTIEWNGCFAYDTVTVFIDAPPTASNPADINVECIGDVPVPDPLVVTDEADDITIPPTVTFVGDVSDGLTCPETITRTYRVEDACGNFIEVQQSIIVMDTQAPTFNAPPGAITVECIGDVPAMTNLGWTDNCDGTGDVAGNDVSDGMTCPETITRTWTYTDACGNAATETQTITVMDTQVPVFAAPPAAVTVECAADVPAMTNLGWTDNCDGAGTVAGNDVSDGMTCPETITRTWTYTDACGNTASVTQTITVDDTTPPTASNPAPISVGGGTPIPPADPLVVTDEADNCTANPVVAWVSDVSDNGNCPEIITRTYSVTDDCGNQILVTQQISVGDAVLPTASNPAPINVQCIGDVPAPDPLVVTDEADNGAVAPVVTFEGELLNGQTCPTIITRTYRVTDDCGNFIFVTQTITVLDTQAPVFAAAPANVTVECIGDVPAMTNLGWTDNCDGSGTVIGNDVSDGQSCPETITRTWTYTDVCGNVGTATQTITVMDTQAPVMAAPPANVTVECAGDVPAMTNLGWTDNCDGSGTVVGYDVSDGMTCPETITRTWTYTDACGNVSTETQTITVDDTTPPTASNPPTTVVPGGPVPPVDVTIVFDEADNCTANPVVTFVSEVSDNNPCPETITRIYEITDDCGNTSQVTHLIQITDPILPTGTAPAPITVECIGDVPAADPLLITDEADNQGVPVVAHVGDVSDGQSCPETITRTYSITDVCGNVVTVDQIITVLDITAPVMDAAPADVTVECIGDVPAMLNLGWTDNCDGAGTIAGNDVSDGMTCPETITRTWTYTDACGNTSSVSQTITVFDTTPPTATAPSPANVECIGDVPVADITSVTNVNDNCSANPIVAFVGDVSDGLSCPETITRTYSITDDCGNTTTVDQLIIVNDVTPPTASNPAGISVPGPLDVPAPDITVVTNEADNCTLTPVVAWVSDVSDGNVCNGEIVTRTYSITDDCGNQTLVTQDITILATPAPIDAGNDTIVCSGQTVTITASNPWGAQLSWSPQVPQGPFTPVGTTTYTVTANNLGCISTDQITVSVEDPPQVSFFGDNLLGCAPHTVTLTNTSSSLSGMSDCIWTINGQQLSSCTTGSFTFDTPGTYDITLTTTSLNGCTATETYSQYVYVEGNPNAAFTPSQTELSSQFTQVNFTNNSTGATSYNWEFGEPGEYSTEENPTHTYPEEPGTYTVLLTAYSDLGCMDQAYATITINEELIYYVPNTFTPDGDDYNETFHPVFTEGYDPYDFHLLIFNRWGEVVWESYDASVGWDGTYGMSGNPVQDGTYTWKLEFKTTLNDERKFESGHVNLIR